MRADSITVRKLDAAEAAFAIGVILGGAGALHGEGVSTIVGATLVLLGATGVWRELERAEPPPVGAPHAEAPRNRRRLS